MSGTTATLAELLALRAAHTPARASARGARDARLGSRPLALPPAARGLEFAGARPYQPGDDARTVDWRQSARRGRLSTKVFEPEGDLALHLWVDLGPRMRFGTRGAFKSVAAARAAAWLGWAAVDAGDRVGGLVCNGELLRRLPPRSCEAGCLALLGALVESCGPLPDGPGEPAWPALAHAARLRPGSRLVVISDFAGADDATERALTAATAGCATDLVWVHDRFESEAPPPGLYRIHDRGRDGALDLRSAAARAGHAAAFDERRRRLQAWAVRIQGRLVELATDAAPASALWRLGAPAGGEPRRGIGR